MPPWPILVLSLVFIVGAAMTMWGPVNLLATRGGDFPEPDPDRPVQQLRIVDILHAQYVDQPGPSRYFTRGTGQPEPSESDVAPAEDSPQPPPPDPEGPWDAAFVSWVLNEAGLPVRQETPANPDAWLIADTLELARAFDDRGAYLSAADAPEFSPQLGDLIFYDYPGPLGHHVNIVVGVHGDVVTVGGDEFGRVGLASMNLRGRGGIMGWGATGLLKEEGAQEEPLDDGLAVGEPDPDAIDGPTPANAPR